MPLGLAATLATAVLALAVNSPSLAYGLSLATAYSALVLFGVSLVIGPLSLLRQGRLPAVSTDLRRD